MFSCILPAIMSQYISFEALYQFLKLSGINFCISEADIYAIAKRAVTVPYVC